MYLLACTTHSVSGTEPVKDSMKTFTYENIAAAYTRMPGNIILPQHIDTIYACTERHLLWFDRNGQIIDYAQFLLNTCKKAIRQSWIYPEVFQKLVLGGMPALNEEYAQVISDHDLWNLDIKLTRLAYALAHFEAKGQIEPFRWEIKPDSIDVSGWICQQFKQHRFESFESLNPDILGYGVLINALDYYSRLSKNIRFEPIQIESKLEPGIEDKRIKQIRIRLAMLLSDGAKLLLSHKPEYFDESLVDAVKDFQKNRGLKSDGTIGFRTMHFLNLSPDSVKEKIFKNLERIKWMPSVFPEDDYILVNLPDYKIKIMHGNQEIFSMNCIIGKYKNQTPVFSDTMQYLVMSPFWNIPKSIAVKEIWGHVSRDPDYLEKHHMQVFIDGQNLSEDSIDWSAFKPKDFEYRIKIRQIPGKHNSLGRIKFIFPNDHWVYLHDTNAKYLFAKEERALSHGCIRIEKPLDLAMYVLRDNPDWDTTKLLKAMDTTAPEIVHLKHKIPIFLYYLTAWGEQGQLQLRRDPYLLDQKMDSLLNVLRYARKSDDLLVVSEDMH